MNVDFEPDEVIVKGINYNPVAAEPGVTLLYCDLVQDNIGSFFQDFYVKPDLVFQLNKPVRGLYTFQIRDIAGTLHARTGDLGLHLSFVKYKAKGKIY